MLYFTFKSQPSVDIVQDVPGTLGCAKCARYGHLAALSRRSWATAQFMGELLAHLHWWRAYYHFCRPHLSLRLKLDLPQARRGAQTPRRFAPRTPAMAAGLTDHLWSVQELLAFPVG